MAKHAGVTRSRGSIIGAVGAILIGAAVLLFVAITVLSNLKAIAPGPIKNDTTEGQAYWSQWNTTNATYDSLITFLTIVVILLGVLGITMVGATIIQYIGAGFG